MMSKKSPQLRFEGFTDDWEQRKLSDLMTFSNGINAPKENYGTGTKMISVMDILNPLPMKYDNILNSVAVDKKIEDKNKVEKGDLIFVRSSEIVEEVGWAKAYKEDHYALYSGFAIRGKRISSYNAYFIELTLNYANRKEIKRRAGGSTRFNVSQEILNSLNVLTPSISEQNQIDLFFTKIDDTITLHQRKLDLLKEQKKGYLQKMFPKNGAKVPELRFAGFADDWEERKLGDIFKKDTQKNKDLEFHSDSVISVAKMKLSPPSAKSSDEYMKTYNKIRKGNVAFEGHTNDEFPNGRFVLNDCQDGIVSHIYDVYSAVDEYNNEFMKRYINNPDVMRKILINATSSARMMKSLNSIEFLKQSILLPILSEQQKIGKFFYQLDNTITLHQRKLDLLKEQKKGFLQKMFV